MATEHITYFGSNVNFYPAGIIGLHTPEIARRATHLIKYPGGRRVCQGIEYTIDAGNIDSLQANKGLPEAQVYGMPYSYDTIPERDLLRTGVVIHSPDQQKKNEELRERISADANTAIEAIASVSQPRPLRMYWIMQPQPYALRTERVLQDYRQGTHDIPLLFGLHENIGMKWEEVIAFVDERPKQRRVYLDFGSSGKLASYLDWEAAGDMQLRTRILKELAVRSTSGRVKTDSADLLELIRTGTTSGSVARDLQIAFDANPSIALTLEGNPITILQQELGDISVKHPEYLLLWPIQRARRTAIAINSLLGVNPV